MDRFDNLINSSVKNYYEEKEQKNKLDNKKFEANCQVTIKNSDKITKKRKNKEESSDDDEDFNFELPRKRVMFYGELKKRKRMMTKYERGIRKEREEEKFYAEVFFR